MVKIINKVLFKGIIISILFCHLCFYSKGFKPDTVIKGTDINSIILYYSYSNSILKFRNDKKIDVQYDKEFISAKITSDGTRAAVIRRMSIKDTSNSIVLFDIDGYEITSFASCATQIINYNNNKILVECDPNYSYGSNKKKEHNKYIEVKIYDEKGNDISEKKIAYKTNCHFYYSKTNNVLFCKGYISMFEPPTKSAIYFFNNELNIIGEYLYDCYNGGKVIEINDETSTITIQYISGNRDPEVKETITVSFYGSIKSRKLGWEKATDKKIIK